MLAEKFGACVGGKFNADGSVRFFPGNTMVCILDHSTEVFRRAKAVRTMFEESDLAGNLTFLPDESLHMTAIEGVCDQVRDKDHWTSLLPTTAKLVEVDDLFERLWKEVPMPGKVHMRFEYLRIIGGICIGLYPASFEDDKAMRDWRDLVGKKMGLWFQGHDRYAFHISLAYGIKPLNEAQHAEIQKIADDFVEECKRHPFVFEIPQPSMTYFDNMLFFNTRRIPRKEA